MARPLSFMLQLLFGCLSATAHSIGAVWCFKNSSQTYLLKFEIAALQMQHFKFEIAASFKWDSGQQE
jgi:hypothetical protein